MNTALSIEQPIFDCSCFAALERQIKAHWVPPKHGGPVTVAFRTTRLGTATDIRLEKSSGIADCDQAALRAIKDIESLYVPSGEAKLFYDFGFDKTLKQVGLSILLEKDKQPPAVSFVNSEASEPVTNYYFQAMENNSGVIELLDGHALEAQDMFKKSASMVTSYLPAIHNLKIALKSKSTLHDK